MNTRPSFFACCRDIRNHDARSAIRIFVIALALMITVLSCATRPAADPGRDLPAPDKSDISDTLIAAPDSILTDIDGNGYSVFIVGEKLWMGEDLKVTRYSNGKPLTQHSGTGTLSTEEEGMYVLYVDTGATGSSIGLLYNYHAILEGRLCPEGWRIPAIDDWHELFTHMGGPDSAAGRIQSESTTFSVTYGGMMTTGSIEPYHGKGMTAYWWSSTSVARRTAAYVSVEKGNPAILQGGMNENSFLSVRCIKE
jgi:uncharacterized protein (TIGR02145 family)